MNTITACTYWVIVAIWLITIVTAGYFYFSNKRIIGTARLLLLVVVLDATRNIIENIYFGLFFGSKYGLFPAYVGQFLGNPNLLILPKISNMAAGCFVLGMLLWKWLPQEIRERTEAEEQVKYLHRLATTDEMTGFFNRREFFIQAAAEWERYSRYGRTMSLAIIDIDHFKLINDKFGHIAGDEFITLIAQICLDAKRLPDIAGRLGGEEFAILLPETGLDEAQVFAERLRLLVAAETPKLLNGQAPTTISVGLSCTPGARTMMESLRQADLALYEAKRTGRNKVCYFDTSTPARETSETVS
jgi:diguanylate cyclase (GGDEF)-like protein